MAVNIKYFLIFFLVITVVSLPSNAYARSAFEDPVARSASGNATSGDGLVAVESEVDGGSVSIGATASVVVLFRNESSRPVKVERINLYPSSTVSSSITLNQCAKGELPSFAECAVVVAVKGLQEGAWRVEMLMGHSGKSRLVTATLTGNVEDNSDGEEALSSDVETIPSEVDFGSLDSSQTLVKSIIFRNIMSETIDIKDISVKASSQSGYSVNSDCARLKTGESCIATVSWTPQKKGPSQGFLIIEHTGPSAITSVNLIGEFTPETSKAANVFPEAVPGRGLLVSSSSEINFGNNIENSSAITVSMVNVGDTEMNILDISLSGTDNGLSIAKKGCMLKRKLQPIEACPLTINWSPPRKGAIIDDLQIIHDGARGVLVIPVRGAARKAVSNDSKAIVEIDGVQVQQIDKTEVLDGFVVTTHAKDKAIIAGPGGSRVVKQGQDVVMGGVSWKINIIDTGVEFISGTEKVILLFDKSLSSVGRYTSTSNANSTSGYSSNSTSGYTSGSVNSSTSSSTSQSGSNTYGQ